jgi:hypothetical protein
MGGYGTRHRDWRGVEEVEIPATDFFKPEVVRTPGVFIFSIVRTPGVFYNDLFSKGST